MSPRLEWSDDRFSVGVTVIDQQHRTLVDLFNAARAAVHLDHPGAELMRIATRLVDYAGYHFETEEALMRQYALPLEAAHRASHNRLRNAALDLLHEIERGDIAHRRIVDLLMGWLVDHILSEDMELGRQLKALGVN